MWIIKVTFCIKLIFVTISEDREDEMMNCKYEFKVNSPENEHDMNISSSKTWSKIFTKRCIDDSFDHSVGKKLLMKWTSFGWHSKMFANHDLFFSLFLFAFFAPCRGNFRWVHENRIASRILASLLLTATNNTKKKLSVVKIGN